jgi:hypothetical protein
MDCLLKNKLLDERGYKIKHYHVPEVPEEPNPSLDIVQETVFKTKKPSSSSSNYKYKKRKSSTTSSPRAVKKLGKEYVIALTGFRDPERTDLESVIKVRMASLGSPLPPLQP